MTLDDENSVYVGGLPYDCNESQLRRAFDLYGSIVAVKIINDRGVGGKCYGFVTFTNPRSAAEAIDEMDGRTIGGRVVRVNEVKARGAGARSNYGRDSFRRSERDLERGKHRDNDYDKGRHRDRSLERNGKRERGYDHTNDHDHASDQFHGKDGGRDMEEADQGDNRHHDREWERDETLVATQDRQFDRADDHGRRGSKNKGRHLQRKNSSSSHDRQSREHSRESSDYYHQVEDQLHLLIKKREELQKEKSDMEHKLEEKKQLVTDLQKRSLKLEDGLISAKKMSSLRQMQLTKLYKCFHQVKEYAERLKGSEEELQDLVNSVGMEIDTDGDLGTRDLYVANGF